ncbi:MAG TPA: transglycosylase domain-containing protein, partial [Fibrobacteraceae bacterium]|nr:transglycosylase domain-containing protein [Fibrobacteraceae bacterium]
MRKKKKKSHAMHWLLFSLLLTGAMALTAWYLIFRYLPTQDPEKQFTRTNILSILSGETRVYFRDGKTLHGAFFDANHRVYVPYSQIPPAVVNALVASEDARFFQHGGFDPRGFARAVFINLRHLGWVQGGSTLTQQTAKNIFGREERSLGEKFKELESALRLEHNFRKEDILEFYLNQFHVTGTGRGLSIAAWHFFSKDLSQLNLAECAFIAGSVKGPAKYDPFIQKTQEGRERAMQRANIRLRYVLERMLDEGYITQAEFDQALREPLHFQMGQFRFSQSSTMERLEEKLNGPFYSHLFDSLGIDTWQKAQLRIITTLDAQADSAAASALQANLADLQMRLGGFSLPKGVRPDNVTRLRSGEYLYGSLDSVIRKNGHLESLWLRFGVSRGVIRRTELDTFALRHRLSADRALAGVLNKGAVLLVRILDTGRVAPCRLETEPVVQGGLVALSNGQVLASQGGFHNTGFDRVNQAERQFGSSWKPLLIALSLQMGWHYLDTLDNTWNLFPFVRTFYFPRPDHEERAPKVSIAWMAARSENIAAIWLLDHLLDHLSAQQLHGLALRHGYLRREGEDDLSWRVRLRDSLGLIATDAVQAEIAFIKARDSLVRDLRREGQEGKAWTLTNLFYGSGIQDAAKEQKKFPNNLALLRFNYLSLHSLLQARLNAETRGDDLVPTDSVILRDSLTLTDFIRLEARLIPPQGGDWMLDESQLLHWPDLRRSLAMDALVEFCHEIGIRSKIKPVLSMPLGTNDVTLAEMAVAYQTLFTGQVHRCLDGNWNEPCLIQEIQAADGHTLFRNTEESRIVLADSITAQIAAILRETFESGTARGGLNQAILTPPDSLAQPLAIPVAGKTGTTNDYRNVAFLGALPGWDSLDQSFHLDQPIILGSYVGFDDNRTMQGRG